MINRNRANLSPRRSPLLDESPLIYVAYHGNIRHFPSRMATLVRRAALQDSVRCLLNSPVQIFILYEQIFPRKAK